MGFLSFLKNTDKSPIRADEICLLVAGGASTVVAAAGAGAGSA